MALADEHAGVVDGFGQAQFEHLGLQAALQEILDFQAQDVIQLHLAFVQHADPDQAAQEGVAWKRFGVNLGVFGKIWGVWRK